MVEKELKDIFLKSALLPYQIYIIDELFTQLSVDTMATSTPRLPPSPQWRTPDTPLGGDGYFVDASSEEMRTDDARKKQDKEHFSP